MNYILQSCVYAWTLSSSLQLVFEVLPRIKGFKRKCVWRDVMGLSCVFNVLFWMCTNLKHCIHQIYTYFSSNEVFISWTIYLWSSQPIQARRLCSAIFRCKNLDIHFSIWHAFLAVAQNGVFPPQSPVGEITHQVHGRPSLYAGTVLTSTDPK